MVRYGRKDIERLELRIKSLELELRNKDIELQGLKEKNEGYRRSVNGR